MSIEARQAVVNSPNTFFQIESCRTDLLDPALTDTNLIALSQHLLDAGYAFEYTMVRTGHRDDGKKGHFGGLAFDFWPLKTATAGDWLDAGDPRFQAFLACIASFKGLYQLGLAGTADTPQNAKATGLPYNDFSADPCAFSDEGADHVHAGVHPA
jgi:hypothetical protein